MLLAGFLAAGLLQPAPVHEIPYDADPAFLELPDTLYFGEVAGVAVNSQGHIFAFSRGGTTGPAFGAAASQLFEFDRTGRFVREIGKGLYAMAYAHSVRIDRDDNIWIVDKGSDMVVKLTPQGRVAMVFGRKKEASDEAVPWTHVNPPRPQVNGMFRQPTDVTWDPQGNIFISDGYVNSRVAKYDRNGDWVKSWGEKGTKEGQFDTPHSIAADAAGNVYVADRGNRRIQVFDNDLNPVRIIANVGAPWSICTSPAPNQFLFSGDGNGKIYKVDMSGNLVGWAQTSEGHGQTGCLVHELHCESDTVIYKGDCSTWTVEKITFKGAAKSSAP